jgi:methionyl-tRNA synthetase
MAPQCWHFERVGLQAGIALPKQVFGHGFVMDKNGEKMSKSIGNVVDPVVMLDKYVAVK